MVCVGVAAHLIRASHFVLVDRIRFAEDRQNLRFCVKLRKSDEFSEPPGVRWLTVSGPEELAEFPRVGWGWAPVCTAFAQKGWPVHAGAWAWIVDGAGHYASPGHTIICIPLP
jgi:hypothetical protein